MPRRRRWLTVTVAAVAGVSVIGVAALPSPYVIDGPGPVFNTIGQTEVTQDDGSTQEEDVIQVDGLPTYETSGSLNMLTVSQWGTPSDLPSALQVLQAWIDPTMTVVPLDQAYPPGTTTESEAEANSQAMTASQQSAAAAAFTYLGYEVTPHLQVVSVQEDSDANGVLESGDVIETINGQQVSTVDEVLAEAEDASAENPLVIEFQRDGVAHTAEVVPVTGDDEVNRIGVSVTSIYDDLPADVTITLEDVGGPSAGMMFALGVIDTLTPGELTGGHTISGTGTITADGTVGAIGGIRQKMVAADEAGTELFLAPSENCSDVVGNIPDGLTVVSVSTLTDAVDAIETFTQTGSAAGLATCS